MPTTADSSRMARMIPRRREVSTSMRDAYGAATAAFFIIFVSLPTPTTSPYAAWVFLSAYDRCFTVFMVVVNAFEVLIAVSPCSLCFGALLIGVSPFSWCWDLFSSCCNATHHVLFAAGVTGVSAMMAPRSSRDCASQPQDRG